MHTPNPRVESRRMCYCSVVVLSETHRAELGPKQRGSDPGLRLSLALLPNLWPTSQAEGQIHPPRAAQRRMHKSIYTRTAVGYIAA